MSDDDWEGWEDKEVELPNVKAPVGMTATEALTKAGGYDASKFEGEDEEEDSPKYVVPESQPKKERVSKYAHKENMGVQKYVGDVTDKLAQQRLQQEAELGTIAETFGAGREVNELDRFIPVKKEDYKKFGKMVAQQYVVVQHGKPGAHYKVLIKSLMREVAEPCTASDLRDLETEVAKLRKEKASGNGLGSCVSESRDRTPGW